MTGRPFVYPKGWGQGGKYTASGSVYQFIILNQPMPQGTSHNEESRTQQPGESWLSTSKFVAAAHRHVNMASEPRAIILFLQHKAPTSQNLSWGKVGMEGWGKEKIAIGFKSTKSFVHRTIFLTKIPFR